MRSIYIDDGGYIGAFFSHACVSSRRSGKHHQMNVTVFVCRIISISHNTTLFDTGIAASHSGRPTALAVNSPDKAQRTLLLWGKPYPE